MHLLFIPIAGLLSMDRLTAFNFMFSRPLALSGILGLLYGNAEWCILGGIFFELLGIMDIPVGTRVANDDTFGAFAYTVIAVEKDISGLSAALAAVLAATIVMFPVTRTVRYMRRLNRYFLEEKKLSAGGLIFAGQCASFLRGVFVYSLGALFSIALFMQFVKLLPSDPPLWAVAIPFATLCGYFAGFFNIKILQKLALLALGGGISWLIF